MESYAVLGGLLGGVWLLLLWLSIIVWVYRDIRDRTRDLGLQVLAVFVAMMFFPGFNIPGLALYLMLRPRETLEEAYARSLEEEALLREIGDDSVCSSCRRFVEKIWQVCPYCRTQLKDTCSDCEQLLSFNWISCPYCGKERRGASAAPALQPYPLSASSPAGQQSPASAPSGSAGSSDQPAQRADGRQALRRREGRRPAGSGDEPASSATKG